MTSSKQKQKTKQIKAWSHSRLADFESCKYRAKLKMIDKVPEPERPLPPGKTEHANDRGTRIHNECELYVRGEGPLPVEAESYRKEFESLATKFAEGSVFLEGEWGFTKDWGECDYNDFDNIWLRIKIDALVFLSEDRAVVIDYKTGRKFGNEIKHAEQTQLYALATALRFPKLKHIDVELWYLDQDEITHEQRPAQKWRYHHKLFHNRGLKMTNETQFPPNPTKFTCKWCPYKEGICEYAVK